MVEVREAERASGSATSRGFAVLLLKLILTHSRFVLLPLMMSYPSSPED